MLLAVLAAALLLRLHGISWGLPDVFEEATPMREAWKMWGWGPGAAFDPNPHFFHYPSLTIYCHLIGQGLLYLGMRLIGNVDSTTDFAALYAADPTPFLVTARLIATLFGAGTVLALYRLCRKAVSPSAALAAAFFLAISTFHIERSQMVEVDVPLAFFCTLALLFIVRISERPTRGNYLLAGLFTGFAVSTKYTAALLVIPLVISHLLAGTSHGTFRSEQGKRESVRLRWRLLLIAGCLIILTFFITSPFVVLDFTTFRAHLSIEQTHMREGHFGLERSGTVLFYLRALSERILGWPLLALAAVGIAFGIGRRGKPAYWIVLSFALPYCIAVAAWAMKADRYLLPLLPVLLLFAATVFDFRLPALAAGKRRLIVAALLFMAATVPLAARYPAHARKYETDSRTLAREWLEANVPSGAFIVSESYGPELMGPQMLLSLDKGIRTKLLERTADRPQYAVQPVPMMQVYPELTAVFYDLRLYPDADVIITSSAVASRYRREPKRFPGHIAFYRGLEKDFMVVGEFEGGTGPRVTIYKTRERKAPFAGRRSVVGPQPLRPAKLTGSEALFYSNLGANYEAFRFYEEANACYDMALGYPLVRPHWFSEIVVGKTRALMALGRVEESVAFLRAAANRAPSAAMRERVENLIRSIREDTDVGE